MSRIIKFILFLAFFLIFFEVGLISAYTLVTSQPPDVEKLIGMQVDRLSAIFNIGDEVNSALAAKPKVINITNAADVADALQNKSKLDGINLQSLNVTTFQDTSDDVILVNITATGYQENQAGGGNSSGGQIVITPSSTFTIIATASGKKKDSGIEIDLSTIKIVSIGRIYTNQ
jgi:hypothetical protein